VKNLLLPAQDYITVNYFMLSVVIIIFISFNLTSITITKLISIDYFPVGISKVGKKVLTSSLFVKSLIAIFDQALLSCVNFRHPISKWKVGG
jgi:hypothetical protein